MSRSLRAPLVCALVAAVAAFAVVSAKTKIEVHYDRNANFGAIKTYTWLPSPPFTAIAAPGTMRDPKVVQAELEPIILAAADANLRKLGLQRVEQGGDVQLVFYLSHGTSMATSTMGSYYQYATDFYVGGIYGGQTTYSQVVEEGSLVIDVVDDRRAIWRGHASAKLNRENDDKKRRKVLEDAIKNMFDKWPKK
jgi:hypothetical protein